MRPWTATPLQGVVIVLTVITLGIMPAQGDENQADSASPPKELPDLFDLNARRAVREGNRLLTNGKPQIALQAYDYAGKLRPEAREIDFVRGLAHFDRRELDEARQAFRKVSASGNDALAHDALYGLGTCDHVEALDSVAQDPQLALSLLENAMKRYHEVLTRRPDHQAARDANRKAALMWRELKRQLQEQQQQKNDGECDNSQEKENEDSEKDQRQQQNEQEQQQDSQTPTPNQQQQEQQQRQQESPQPQQEQQEQQQQASEAQQQEQASREQAERKLREMMQAQRQRNKIRPQQVQRIPVSPVDKDW